MALDEPRDADDLYEIDGFKFIVNKDFLTKAQPIRVDFINVGFKITAGIEFGGGGCSGCGTQGTCCS